MMGYGGGFGLGFGYGGLLMALGCVAVVVGIVLLAAWALGRGGRPAAPPSAVPSPAAAPRPDALEILRLRLARGEVTVDEFAAAKQALEAGR